MKLKALKKLAEQFRKIADNQSDVGELAYDLTNEHTGDKDVAELCQRLKAAPTGDDVRTILDAVAARTR